MGNQTLGRGKVYVSLFKAGGSGYDPAGFRYIGNTPAFNLTIDNQKLEHFSSDEGIRTKDKSIILETTQTGTLTCDDISLENLALFFFGEFDTASQTSATGEIETMVDVQQGLLYQIGVTDGNPTGVRSITPTTVKVGVTTKTAVTDYVIDNELGTITIVEGGGIADNDDIIITYDRAAKSRDQVISGTDQVEGALMYVSANPEGDKMDYLMPYVRLSPNGDFALKSDEWQQLNLNVEILTRPNREAIYLDGRPYTP